MARRSIPSYFYVLVVVPRAGRYLMVQERKHGQTWYLPSGGMEPGESIHDAAIRETKEEAGIRIAPRGLIGVDHQWLMHGEQLCCKWRFMVLAQPCDEWPVKTRPDRHTLGARWAEPREIRRLPLRSPEVLGLIEHVEKGGLVVPLSFYEDATQPALAALLYD